MISYLYSQTQLDLSKTSRIETLRRSGFKTHETEDIVDEEEFKLMKDLREAKRTYKNRYEQLQKYRRSLAQSIVSVDLIKAELAVAYTDWGGNNTEYSSLNRTRRPESPSQMSTGIFSGEMKHLLSMEQSSLSVFLQLMQIC